MRLLPLLTILACTTPVFAVPVHVEIDQVRALAQPPAAIRCSSWDRIPSTTAGSDVPSGKS